VQNGLATVIMIASLLVGGWCFVAAARDRWIDVSHLVGLVLVELAVLVQTVLAAVALGRGDRPVEFATFVGYLVVTVLLLPAAVVLSFLERTRWGAVIAGGGAVVTAVLVLRLTQVWSPLR
jgi:hypothetical protein